MKSLNYFSYEKKIKKQTPQQINNILKYKNYKMLKEDISHSTVSGDNLTASSSEQPVVIN